MEKYLVKKFGVKWFVKRIKLDIEKM